MAIYWRIEAGSAIYLWIRTIYWRIEADPVIYSWIETIYWCGSRRSGVATRPGLLAGWRI